MMLKEIIDGCQRDERISQEMFHKKYYLRLKGVSIKMSPDIATAEDMLQNAFIKIFRNIHTINKNIDERVYFWCKRILINLIIDFYRNKKNKLTIRMDMSYVVDGEDGDDYLNSKNIKAEMIHNAIKTLSPQYKLVFTLYVLKDYTHMGISEELGISVGTSKANLSKARSVLRKKLITSTI